MPIDGSCDGEISIKGIENAYLQEGLKNWSVGGVENLDPEEDEEETEVVGEVEEEAEDEDVFYEDSLYGGTAPKFCMFHRG